MRDGFADALAKELGVDAAKVRAAIDEVHKTGGPPDLGAVATKLGVTEAKLRAALQDLRPGARAARSRPARRPRRASTAAATARRSSTSSPRTSASARPSCAPR